MTIFMLYRRCPRLNIWAGYITKMITTTIYNPLELSHMISFIIQTICFGDFYDFYGLICVFAVFSMESWNIYQSGKTCCNIVKMLTMHSPWFQTFKTIGTHDLTLYKFVL